MLIFFHLHSETSTVSSLAKARKDVFAAFEKIALDNQAPPLEAVDVDVFLEKLFL